MLTAQKFFYIKKSLNLGYRNIGFEIKCEYEVIDNEVLLNIAQYNKNKDIVIDPYRIWATYYGGSGHDRSYSICTDNSGSIYVTGWTESADFPIKTLSGAYNKSTSGNIADAYIIKFNSAGTRLWSTYYGGSDIDYGEDICTDNFGNLYVTGETVSIDFPTHTLPGAYNQAANGGSYDIFILKFNNTGAIEWATLYGGISYDYGWNICTDNSGNLYVTGGTASSDFPTQNLTGAYNQNTLGGIGWWDAFIMKFDNNGARLWATYYGGSTSDYAWGVCTDKNGNIYVTGATGSANFPTLALPGAYNQTTFGGVYHDAFILKFSSSSTRLWATYYGGSEFDVGRGLCIDNSGALYITGYTASTNFPTQTLTGAYNQPVSGGGNDAFLLKFDDSCARQWATYYGGSNEDIGHKICVNKSDNLYVTGWTESADFPTQTLAGAYNQPANSGGDYDAFILNFNNQDSREWATYYGGSGSDEGHGICTDSSGSLYVTGLTSSTNLPEQILSGAYNQTGYGGGDYDSFILKFSMVIDGIKSPTGEIPEKYILRQNYPNPFGEATPTTRGNPKTVIGYRVETRHCLVSTESSVNVELTVFNILGQKVATLVNEKQTAGNYSVTFNGAGLPSGLYFYKLQAGSFYDVKRMLLIQ